MVLLSLITVNGTDTEFTYLTIVETVLGGAVGVAVNAVVLAPMHLDEPRDALRDLTSRRAGRARGHRRRPARGLGRRPGARAGTTTRPTWATGCPRRCRPWRPAGRAPGGTGGTGCARPGSTGTATCAPSRPCGAPSGRWPASPAPSSTPPTTRTGTRRRPRAGCAPTPTSSTRWGRRSRTSGCGPTSRASAVEQHVGRALEVLDEMSEEVRRTPLDDPHAWPAYGALVLEGERLARELLTSNAEASVPTDTGPIRVPLAESVPAVAQLQQQVPAVGEQLPADHRARVGAGPAAAGGDRHPPAGPDAGPPRAPTPGVQHARRDRHPEQQQRAAGGLPAVGCLALHEPRGGQPHDRHEHRVGHDRRRRVPGQQGVPDAVADQRGQPGGVEGREHRGRR